MPLSLSIVTRIPLRLALSVPRNRGCASRFFMKQWKVSQNAFDNLSLTEENYPVSRTWTKMYSRECAVQTAFFEALYRTE